MNWYYVEEGRQTGPVEDAQFDALVTSGHIQPDTLVWHEGLANWQPLREVRGEASPSEDASAPPLVAVGEDEAACGECGRIFTTDSMIRHGELWICARCKPTFLQKLSEGAALPSLRPAYGGFWIRFGAKLIDNLILMAVTIVPLIIVLVVVGFRAASVTSENRGLGVDAAMGASAGPEELIGNVLGLGFQCVFNVLNVLYSTIFLGKYGSTPGKMLCGLRVVNSDGTKVTYGRAFGRGCAEILSNLICSIG
jgi:uncharacterized RDD family membrane protein YckC